MAHTYSTEQKLTYRLVPTNDQFFKLWKRLECSHQKGRYHGLSYCRSVQFQFF